ncbi:MAG: hypothetical protein F6K26_36155, partial [Moorea sp. SIO2I5]|nr:hypothetical protein [Moorena sp. SIO2I5]
QLNDSLTEAKLLGFVENVATNELPLRQLQPMAYFPGYLQDLPKIPDTLHPRLFRAGMKGRSGL